MPQPKGYGHTKVLLLLVNEYFHHLYSRLGHAGARTEDGCNACLV